MKLKKIWGLEISAAGMAVLTGLLMTVSFPKAEISYAAWFAIMPLLFALRNLSIKSSFKLGFIAGLVHYLTLLYWLVHAMQVYGYLPLALSVCLLFLLCAYMGLYVAVFCALIKWICKKPAACLFIPVFWVALEYIKSLSQFGFPWEFLGYSQYKHINIIQIADILGVYGLSALIGLANVAFLFLVIFITKNTWNGKKITKKLVSGTILALLAFSGFFGFYGEWRIQKLDKSLAETNFLNTAVVQGNIDQGLKWDAAFRLSTTIKYMNMSINIKDKQPDLVVLPETALPFYFNYDNKLTNLVKNGARESRAAFFVGSPSYYNHNNEKKFYNSAYLINKEGLIHGRYDKVHLVPYGEYVPFKKWLPFLDKIVQSVGDFSAGKKGNILKWKDHPLGGQICFEIIFPELSRSMVKNGATMIVNITNDAWYGRSSAPYQHFSMAVFRAVENKRAVARAANTGISGFIDPAGRIISVTEIFKDAVLTQRLPLMHEKTFYTCYGDIFAVVCLIITGCLIIWRLIKSNKENIYVV
ncbi:Apolipoprotein N-acyltransferase [Candidatus Magnetomoraceae bacterium gMMP-15]